MQFSLASDASLLRNLKKDQQYWAFGQTIVAHFHISPKGGFYAYFAYYSPCHFHNDVAATAKSPATVPQEMRYRNKSKISSVHTSLGWKHYLTGTFDADSKVSVYGYGGLGLMMGTIENTPTAIIDTATYITPVQIGKAHFKRLTLDLALGVELPLGGDFYAYFEGRTLVPTTDYPSPYLLVNDNAPFTLAANLGLRILFH